MHHLDLRLTRLQSQSSGFIFFFLDLPIKIFYHWAEIFEGKMNGFLFKYTPKKSWWWWTLTRSGWRW